MNLKLAIYQPTTIYISSIDSKWISTSIFAEKDGITWYKQSFN